MQLLHLFDKESFVSGVELDDWLHSEMIERLADKSHFKNREITLENFISLTSSLTRSRASLISIQFLAHPVSTSSNCVQGSEHRVQMNVRSSSVLPLHINGQTYLRHRRRLDPYIY